jgi:hypothetical protein
MPIQRPQSRDARELDRASTFGLVIISAAVRMTGMLRSDDGTVLSRWTTASRNDVSLTPRGSSSAVKYSEAVD